MKKPNIAVEPSLLKNQDSTLQQEMELPDHR